ncbi:hypothetical protein CR513_12613, partial [Mucuna pruriens]
MSPYKIFFGKHLPVEIEHRAYWAVKQCNLAYDQVGEQRKFQLQELDELYLEAYENSRIYKQKVKRFHDQQVLRKEFQVIQRLIARKLHSRWNGPFVITNVFPYGVVELKDEHTNNTFQSSSDPLYELDPEIELTLRRLRKARNIVVSNSRNSDSISSSDNINYATNSSDYIEYSRTNIFEELGQMDNNDKTLKELAIPDVYPQLDPAQTYELRSSLIHLLPKFHGLAGEDPHKHLKEFRVGIPEDYIKMKEFSFSLDEAAKDWLYLQHVLFNTWGDMKCIFLEKFFPASRTATIRKEICGIRQQSGETLHEYWERFNKLCATCSHHQISEQLLIQYFYEGLSMMDRSMIDAATRGALMDKTPLVVRHLISNRASNRQQFGIRGPSQSRMVNEIGAASNLRLENQLSELTSLVRELAVRQ